MALRIDRFRVWLAGDDLDGPGCEVVSRNGDQLRAELELSKKGLTPQAAPLTFLSLVIWAAMARQGDTSLRAAEFTDGEAGMLGYTRVTGEDGEPVDPTRQGQPSDSGSPSPHTSPAPSTGSIPASTTD